ncbi:hypothetical protein [Tunturiibacter gelidoferens]|uniref:3-hydroxyisobutyrate dehydrogenase-like beta-hydroxyacid dehydrogenase n=1 Tax=Tunturiibacter gelidiferens TaxID=3069689 RepID=A0A9X0QCJ0_9BACT|nr:hypothetical protein [Edaphobacter lichenicola]MBB5328006.1 3-hydroxyisobutyrate dehydrogenase-like beta-hydroxyacid dehydrogenase [Edaphobacter lichenicola]
MTGRVGGRLAGYVTAQGIAVLGVFRDPKKEEKAAGGKIAAAQPSCEKFNTVACIAWKQVKIL